ncbi:MAG: 3-deoxy-8-phosphooctulonate synthase [Gemmatimonadales bacterium]|jgi:2-dehydro-3-deoxyphosphooctonate aldolase (KDO 8-P synthase)
MTGAAPLFGGDRFLLVAGPCVLEDDELNLEIARAVASVAEASGVRAVFKASFDKANRTSLRSPRGPGLEAGAAALARVREASGLPVLTDVHESGQVAELALHVDALQIPAFLCRQTDLLLAAGASGRAINVKKGQWMAPEEMEHPVAKLRSAGATDLAVTERGTAFGYGRWIVDMRSFALMREACDARVLYDATHSIQLPGGGAGGRRSGGEPEHIERLARAAVAAGAEGLFVEVHPDPASAPSDGANMLPLERLEGLVADVLAIRAARGPVESA